MKYINMLFPCVALATLFICLGCSESDTNLQIELVVLDSEGNETNELVDPHNFRLAIKAINNSNEEIQFFFNDCLLAQQDKDFLMVYENSYEKRPVGRPFPENVNCPMPNDRPFIIAPNSTTLILKYNWLDNNFMLPAGEYFVLQKLILNQGKYNTRVEFTIK